MELREKEETSVVASRELRRRRAGEQADLDGLREEATQLRELGKGLPEELQTSREHVHFERTELERETAALAGDEMVKAQVLQAHHSAVDLYRRRLGLRFEIGEDQEFRFFFRLVDPADHEREFMVAVRVKDEGGYEVVDCAPEVEVAALLEACNRTDNLSGFVRGVRMAFRSLVAAEEMPGLTSHAAAANGAADVAPPADVYSTTSVASIGDMLEMLPLQ